MKKFLTIVFAISFILGLQAQDSISIDSIDLPEITSLPDTVYQQEDEVEIDLNTPSVSEINPNGELPWQSVSIQGKLKMQGLPLSPSLKIFMLRDSLIDLSVRAPFVGEAARILLTPDSVTAVNKMQKTYIKEGITDFLKYYPGGLSDLQDLLMARIFIPGYDLSETLIEDLVDIYPEDGQFNLVPKDIAEIEGIKYGFVVDEYFNPLTLVVLPQSRPDIEIDAFYRYNLKGYDIQLVYQEGDRAKELTLELKEPEYEAETPKELEIGKKFRRLSLSEFLRSF